MRRLYYKTWSVYFFQVDVTLEPDSQVAKDAPEASGAIVDCVIPAQNKREATIILREMLQADGYGLRSIVESGNMLDFVWEDEDVRADFYTYAWAAHCDGIPSYGTFYAHQTQEQSMACKRKGRLR